MFSILGTNSVLQKTRRGTAVNHRKTLLTAMMTLLCGYPISPVNAQQTVSFDQALSLSQKTERAKAPRTQFQIRRKRDKDIRSNAGPLTITLMPGVTFSESPTSRFELQAAVTQSWNLSKLAQKQKDTARVEREHLEAQARLAALRGNLETARYWLELHTQQSIVAIIEAQQATERTREIQLNKAVESGVVTALRLDHQLVVLAELEQRKRQAESACYEASKRLARAMGQPLQGTIRTRGPAPTPPLPSPERLSNLPKHVGKLPQIMTSRLALQMSRARRVEHEAQSGAVGQFGAQLERAGSPGWTIFGVATISFPGQRQRARQRALDHAKIAQGESQIEIERRDLELDLELLLHEAEHVQESAEHLHKTLIPRLSAVVRRTDALVDAGESVQFFRYEAQRQLFSSQIEYQQIQGKKAWIQLQLWLFLGEIYEQGVHL